MGKVLFWDDEWILNNLINHDNWTEFSNDYNRAHNCNRLLGSFKSHCLHKLDIRFNTFSEEMKEFIREFYPGHGSKETSNEFNKRFGKKTSAHAIKVYASRLRLHVTSERNKVARIHNNGRYLELGEKTYRNGYVYVKTKKGIIPESHAVYGKETDGKCLVHLDGNKQNNDADNLYLVDRSVTAVMITQKLWSKDPELTKAGIMCCELEQALKEKEKKNEQRSENPREKQEN